MDNLYYESGYIDDNYFVYTADAVCSSNSISSLSVSVSKIASASVSLTSRFETSATISHLQGADLFAFSDAQLSIEVSRIRDTNIEVTSAYTITANAERTLYLSGNLDSFTAIDTTFNRFRNSLAAIDAAFSSSIDATKIDGVGVTKEFNANLETYLNFSITTNVVADSILTLDASTVISCDAILLSSLESYSTTFFYIDCNAALIKGASSYLQSTTTQAIDNSRIRNDSADTNAIFDSNANVGIVFQADANCGSLFTPSINCNVIINSFAVLDTALSLSIESNLYKSIAVDLASISNIIVNASRSTIIDANLIAESSVSSIGNRASRVLTPTVFGNNTSYSGISLSSTQSKFGGKSLYVEPKTDSILPRGLVYNYDTAQWVGFTNGYTWKTSDLGVNWVRTTNNLTSWSTNKVQFLNFQYVVIADDSTIKTSPDGNVWTTYAAPPLSWDTSNIGYNNGVWFIFYKSVNTLYVATSSNLTSWATRAQMFGFSAGIYSWYVKDIAYGAVGGNTYVSLTASVYNASQPANPLTSNRILKFANISSATSPTAILSSQATYPSYVDYNSMESNSSGTSPLVVSARAPNNSSYTTYYYDGTNVNTYSSSSYGSILYVNNKWVRAGVGGTNLQTSTNNGSTWTDTGIPVRNLQTALSSNSHLAVISRGALEYTDLTNYTSTNPVPNGNYPAYIEYNSADNTDWSSWKTIDFWLYVPTQSTSSSIPIISQTEDAASNGWEVALFANTSNFQITAYNGLDSTQLSISGKSLNAWHHIRIVNNSSIWAMYFDGVKVSSQSYVNLSAITAPLRVNEGYITFGSEAHNGCYLDEVLVSDELLTNPVTETTITIPTSPYVNSIDVDALFHYDNSFDDDAITIARYGDASLSVTASVTAEGAKTSSTVVNLASSSNLTSNALKVAEGYAALQAQFTLATSALDLDIAQADIASVSSLTASISVTKYADVAINSITNLEVQPLRILDASITTNSIASELIAISKIGDFLITLDSTSSMSVTAVKVAVITSAVNSQSNLTANGKLFVGASADITATSAVSCVISRTRTTRLITGAVAYLTAAPGKQFGAIANLTSAFSVIAFTTGTNQGSANLVSTNSISIDANRSRDITSSLEVNSTVYCDTVSSLTRTSIAACEVSSSLEFNISRTREVAITTNSIASELIAISKIGDFLVTLDSISSMSVESIITANGSTDISVTTDLSIDADEIQQLDAQLVSAFTIVAQGDTNINGDADLTFNCQLIIDANRTRNEQAAINVVSSLETTALRIKQLDSGITAQATQTAAIGKITRLNATLTSSFTVSLGGNANFQINLVAFTNASLLARVGAIHIDPTTTYKIPKESRLTFINAETRTISISGDIRDYRIKQETRNHTIREETRLYNIRS